MALLSSSSLLTKYTPKILEEANKQLFSLVPTCGMPLYTSIDLRDSGTRIVAVDVNLFPAGFNNLGAGSLANAVTQMKLALQEKLKRPGPWKIGLVPESHTNNEGYLMNLQALIRILSEAGAEVKLGWSGIPLPKPWEFKFGDQLIVYNPIGDVTTWADVIVLNHDLSGGPLEALKDYNKPIFPNPELGWYKRKKSGHFEIADKVLKNVAMHVPEIDPLDFTADSKAVGGLNFQKKEEIDRLMDEASMFFEKIQKKKRDPSPFIYMKNDSGTYGLGIWKFSSIEELKSNTKALQKTFQRGKQGTQVSRVILQEGIRTRLLTDDGSEFEPVVYSVNGRKIGSFFRFGDTLKEPGETNLNRPGAWFEESSRFPEDHQKMKGLYEFIATLHSVSAALEDCPCSED